ncbi:MAG: polyprenyl synthetase family protein [Aquificae bacterium]|nr:polyprenyl synthetase family protein [Aquificota bacterium]
MNLEAFLRTVSQQVDRKIDELLKPFEPKVLYEAMLYYLKGGGKRIRPALTAMGAFITGGHPEDAFTVGTAIEFIHNYSLIHDDLPAMDDDDFRRGKPSCHKAFGEDLAILAGDALLTYAFQVLSDASLFKKVSAERLLRVSNLIARKAGIEGMVKGQVMDVRKLGDPEEVARYKTAALIEASLVSGALLGSPTERELELLSKIGEKVGILFQVVDDYLDKEGFYEVFGPEGTKEVAQTFASMALQLIRELNKPEKTKLLEEFVYFLLKRMEEG